uniref:RNA helicase n=1 Tax=Acrobeloides nanus TaxID=290746 RepID=A0A914EEH4_9BILA
MSKVAKKRKTPHSLLVLDAETFKTNEYITSTDPSNALILPAKKKKKLRKSDTAASSEIPPEKKINRKKKEKYENRLKQKLEKVSKTKQKELKKLTERKQKKETRESLFESLAQYQLDSSSLKKLTSSSHMQDKEKLEKVETEKNQNFPSKLRSLTGKQLKQANEKVIAQQNYYETDSESEEEDSKMQILDEVKQEEIPEIEIVSQNFKEKMKEENEKRRKEESLKKKQLDEAYEKFMATLEKIKGSTIGVERTHELQAQRSKLPIFAEEQPIVEAINENSVVIVHGETGSGKTTQIPQFLYEAGYTSNGHLIGITEPRRVAAISMARRVGEELNQPEIVSYQIRFEGNRTDATKILFMTDGVLLKELQMDIQLAKYSVIIIDEAHERSMYSDVLIGLLSRICMLRAQQGFPLKLIIMSATLRVEDFTQKRLFPSTIPKLISVESRQFPVTIHFERRTPVDYLEAAYKKVCKIHEKLPEGAILVFLTGQLEVRKFMQWAMSRYSMRKSKKGERKRQKMLIKHSNEVKQVVDVEEFGVSDSLANFDDTKPRNSDLPANDSEDRTANLDEDGVLGYEFEDDLEDELFENNLPPPPAEIAPLYCLPLYSLLSSEKQRRVFEPVPDGCRLCVVATNVAETSLTIPNIRYVVDTGKEKRREHDPITGVSQFNVGWASQASAGQRSGRAGRVREGHAYRLYSSAVFEEFAKFSQPEILNKPVEQLVLHLKSMNIVKVANFPFPTVPNLDQIEDAEKKLIRLGALEMNVKNKQKEARITQLGRTLSMFPLSPQFAKILVMANQHKLLPYAVCLVSILSVREPMISVVSIRGMDSADTQQKMAEMLKQRRSWCGLGQGRRLGDLMVLLRAIGAADFEQMNQNECEKLGLRFKAMQEIRKMRRQLVNLINASCSLKEDLAIDTKMAPPTEEQAKMLRQILVACLSDQIAKRVDRSIANEEIPKGAYQSQKLEGHIFIDATSILYQEEPDFVLYQEIVQVQNRKCMQTVCAVEQEWLPKLAESYCNFQVVEDLEPKYDSKIGKVVQKCKVTFSERAWPLGEADRPMENNILLYKHFAKFLLSGKICPKLEKYTPLLLASPATMTKQWAHLQKRTEALINALVEYEVTSFEKLVEIWKKKSDFLLEEFQMWLPQKLHDQVHLEWPPI